jgi:hypothetical protein
MKASHTGTSRRAFFIQGSATLGAGVATAAGATGLAPAPRAAAVADENVEAIRQAHLAFVAAVENHSRAGAIATHQAYRANALQIADAIKVSADGHHAAALWHVDVKVGTPLEGDSTPAQMARLQGMLADVHWETGRLDVRYVKVDGQWQIASLRYDAA